jgi:hypothetical protein
MLAQTLVLVPALLLLLLQLQPALVAPLQMMIGE